jgi:hypothetical protein
MWFSKNVRLAAAGRRCCCPASGRWSGARPTDGDAAAPSRTTPGASQPNPSDGSRLDWGRRKSPRGLSGRVSEPPVPATTPRTRPPAAHQHPSRKRRRATLSLQQTTGRDDIDRRRDVSGRATGRTGGSASASASPRASGRESGGRSAPGRRSPFRAPDRACGWLPLAEGGCPVFCVCGFSRVAGLRSGF